MEYTEQDLIAGLHDEVKAILPDLKELKSSNIADVKSVGAKMRPKFSLISLSARSLSGFAENSETIPDFD